MCFLFGGEVVAKHEEWLTEEGLLRIQGWAMDGLTEEQIAHNMGIGTKTLYNWKNKHLPILHALKKGKEVVDRIVENALFKSAIGFEYEEDSITNKGEVVRVTKYQNPNTTAQIFWLKNRKPHKWRDKQHLEHDGNIRINIKDDYGDGS